MKIDDLLEGLRWRRNYLLETIQITREQDTAEFPGGKSQEQLAWVAAEVCDLAIHALNAYEESWAEFLVGADDYDE